jgi:drug/metabolite transporter (DMT)-like permease
MENVLFAEIMLSLYPISVKSIDTNIFTQVFVRSIVYAIISFFFISMPIKTILTKPSYLIVSILNLVHIFSSYIAFNNMNAGVAMSLFYIYPLFNLIFKSILTKKPMGYYIIQYFIISFIGVVLISFQSITNNKTIGKYLIGFVAILIAALSESLIYTFYKIESKENPFDGIFTLYIFGSIIMLLFAPKYLQISNNYDNLFKLVVFNIFIGFIGHIFRFYGISRISTEKYSITLFTGVVFAYIFGWVFLGEQNTIYHIIGTLIILFSVYKINMIS